MHASPKRKTLQASCRFAFVAQPPVLDALAAMVWAMVRGDDGEKGDGVTFKTNITAYRSDMAALVRRTSPKPVVGVPMRGGVCAPTLAFSPRVFDRFVPREWMLLEAYEAAERGEHGALRRLQRIFGAPFSEHASRPDIAWIGR